MATRTLNVVVAGDVKGLGRAMGHAERDIGRLQRSAKSAGKDTTAFASVTSSGFSRVGVAARGMAFAGAGGAALLSKSFVTAASDINESLSKNVVLFGRYARQVDQFAKTSATSFGISRKAALEYTGVFGNLFRALGQSQQQSAAFSVRLTKLAADMASFNNTSIEDALEAIRSGLVGETEPLRRFGVNMNDATLRAEAMRQGLVKTTKEALTPQTRALAAQGLIIRQTSNAHGDFRKTQGGLANQTRILKARTSDLSAELGKVLLPIVTRGTRTLNRFITEMRSGRGEGGKFARNMQDVGQVLGTVARAFIVAGKAVIFMVKATERLIRTGRIIGEAIGGALVAAGKMGEGIGKALVKGITVGIRKVAGGIKGAISGAIGKVKDFAGIGDGIGKQIGGAFPLPRGGAVSGNLMGAQAGMRPFAVMGQRFGLGVSSGRRAGARTSSGNQSWHSTGEAIDVAGPAGGMMAYAKAMRSRFGRRLAELIYTPMGAGIKNGQLHQFTGKVAADHFDHVHVAYDLGRPGQGDGPGRRARTGDGIGVAAAAARAAGFRGSDLVTALAVAGPESNYNPRARLNTSVEDSRGLWQINTKAHPWSRSMNLYDPVVNARAAKRVHDQAGGWGPWTGYTSGRYRAFIARARAAALQSRGQGARAGQGSRGGGGPSISELVSTQTDRLRGGAAYAPSFEQQTADAGLGVAEAERSGSGLRQIAALTAQRKLVGARIRKIRAALKKRTLRPATRLRLTTELADLVGTHAQIGTSVRELKTPAAAEAGETPEAPEPPSPLDFLNRDTALAALTPGTEDDLAAATATRDFRAQQFAFSRGGDPRTEAEFAEALKSAQDAVDSLGETIRQAEEARVESERQHTEALNGVRDELKRQTDFAAAVQTTDAYQMKKWVVDQMSGMLAGYGVARSFTPGAGREFVW